MAMAMKLVSTFAIFFILVLVISEIPETEAHDDECLKEYGGDYPVFFFCGAAIYPSICYSRCQSDKGAKGGRCIPGDGPTDGKCLCDFCSDKPSEIPEIRAPDSQCLKEYIGAPRMYCMARIFPSLCYHKCRSEKGAKGGKCDDDSKCFCDFCSDKPYDKFLSNV